MFYLILGFQGLLCGLSCLWFISGVSVQFFTSWTVLFSNSEQSLVIESNHVHDDQTTNFISSYVVPWTI